MVVSASGTIRRNSARRIIRLNECCSVARLSNACMGSPKMQAFVGVNLDLLAILFPLTSFNNQDQSDSSVHRQETTVVDRKVGYDGVEKGRGKPYERFADMIKCHWFATRSASSSAAPTACATRNTSAPRSSLACFPPYDRLKSPTRFHEDPISLCLPFREPTRLEKRVSSRYGLAGANWRRVQGQGTSLATGAAYGLVR